MKTSIFFTAVLALTSAVAVAGYWATVAETADQSLSLSTAFLASARGNTVAYRFFHNGGPFYDCYVRGSFGYAQLLGSGELMNKAVDVITVTTDGHAYMLFGGEVRSYERLPQDVYHVKVPWSVLGTSRPWPSDLKAPRLVAQNGAAGSVFLSFMYPNHSISVVENSISRNGSWTPLSFPLVSNGSSYLFPSSSLQGPSLKMSNSGSVYMLVLDVECSSRNASVLRLINQTFVFVGQRCFCDASAAHLVVPDDGFAIMVVDTSDANAIWELSTADNTWRQIVSRFTFQAQSMMHYAALPNSTHLVAVGSIPYGVNYLLFNNCTHRWESQSEYQFDWYIGGPVVSMADDGRPFVMYLSRPNPQNLMKPNYRLTIVAFYGDVPTTERTPLCIPCVSGTNGSVCSSCPASYEPVPSGRCAQCLRGYYSNGGSRPCGCAPGFASAGSHGLCVQCTGNTYLPTYDGTSCILCASETPMANANKTGCLSCPAGTYTSSQGCLPCAAGSFTSQPGMKTCTLCNRGSYAPAQQQTSCAPCPAGMYNPYVGAAVCLKCKDASKIGQTVGNVDCDGLKSSTGISGTVSVVLLVMLLSIFALM